jgi:hypothetical protein
MAHSREHDIDAQIEALADIFIEGVTPTEARGVLAEGPAALHGACQAWAFEVSEQIVGIEALDPTSAVSLIKRAPVVNKLRECAIEAFLERFGAPHAPELPARPEGLRAVVCTELDESGKRRMSRRARVLCHTLVNGHCISWQTLYYVTRNRDRSQFVLWVEWESGNSWGTDTTTQQGWLDARKGLSERDAALILLEDYWAASVQEWETERPNEVIAYGNTITQDELNGVAARVWPRA